jgi:hypothetical protein
MHLIIETIEKFPTHEVWLSKLTTNGKLFTNKITKRGSERLSTQMDNNHTIYHTISLNHSHSNNNPEGKPFFTAFYPGLSICLPSELFLSPFSLTINQS